MTRQSVESRDNCCRLFTSSSKVQLSKTPKVYDEGGVNAVTSGAGLMTSRKTRLAGVTSAMVRGRHMRYRSAEAMTDPGT